MIFGCLTCNNIKETKKLAFQKELKNSTDGHIPTQGVPLQLFLNQGSRNNDFKMQN